MECDRLKRLVKNWYTQVQEETMAPARMVTFMRQHLAECPVCLSDPFVRLETDKIIELILPANKFRNTVDEESAKGQALKLAEGQDEDEEFVGDDEGLGSDEEEDEEDVVEADEELEEDEDDLDDEDDEI